MRNITFDQEKLSAIIVAYKKYFPSHWKDEMYKWEAVQHFQKYWDVNAQNFLDMFMEATDKTYNLLANMNNYPRGMIKSFSTVDPEAVRSMFIQLFDESKELSERIDHFMSSAEELRVKYDDGTWKQHYQTANAISTYLWLKYPDKYYIYKYSEVRAVARKIDSDFVPKKGSSAANIENSFKLYNEIREILADDRELDKMFKSVLNESCYPDPRKITMTLDLGFFVNRFYNQEKEFNLDALHSDARFSKWYAPVVETLYKMGGSGKRPDIHQKIIEDYGITDDELKSVNSTGNAQVLNDIDWARNYLVYEGILDKGENGVWILTELGKKVIITDELAGKLTAKWIKIKTAEREHRYVPDIDLSPYYVYREEESQNSVVPYTKEDFLGEVYMSEESYDTLVALLKNKKNLILQGAPGVGKTFAAKRLAYSLIGEKDDSRIEFIQFHQNYSYEDFIMGYKPQEQGFKLTNGIFYRFCMTAADHPEKDYYFIIDEISLMYQRNNKNYEMLINICYFVLDGMLQTTDKGNYKMMTFSDEHMHRLYEKFVLEYFKRHHSYLSEVRAAQVKWNLATDTEESMIRFLPAMQTDIFLRYKEKVLIIDTKYYGNSMQKQYDKVTIHSGNMYQIFTYVKNQDVENNGRVSGMLLYAKTEEAITPDCSFVIGGNKISVKTVDLNKEFKLIAAQLDKIAEDYFGKKRIEDSII